MEFFDENTISCKIQKINLLYGKYNKEKLDVAIDSVDFINPNYYSKLKMAALSRGFTFDLNAQDMIFVEGSTINRQIADSEIFINGRTVEIKDFWMCDHEVTQGEYELYCNYGSYMLDDYYGKGYNNPTYYVSWYDAIVYCNNRSLDEGFTPCYSIKNETDPTKWGSIPNSSNSTWDAVKCDDFETNGYRLPTEVEWEYAARGGNDLIAPVLVTAIHLAVNFLTGTATILTYVTIILVSESCVLTLNKSPQAYNKRR